MPVAARGQECPRYTVVVACPGFAMLLWFRVESDSEGGLTLQSSLGLQSVLQMERDPLIVWR